MKLSELLKDVEVLELRGDACTEVDAVVYDSRKATPGCLFAALKGLKAAGADFIGMAVEKGACAVVTEEYKGAAPPGAALLLVADARTAAAVIASNFYGRPSSKLKLAGVTGTNGKTTTSYLIKSVLEAWDGEVGLLGTISYQVGGRTLPAPNTTPESVDLQHLLSEMVSAGSKYAVIEVSSHSISLRRVAGCEFAVKVFTNLTQDHLDFHGGMDEYYAAKRSFFTDYGGTSVVNLDDPKGSDLAASATGGVITYAVEKGADLTARDIKLTHSGLTFRLVTPKGEARVESGLVGRYNVYNILAAAGACLALDVSLPAVAGGVAAMRGVPGRFEKVEAGQDFGVLVDYAHTEDALASAMTAAREFTKGRLITLFGCGGDRDRGKRPKMGRAASRLSDIVVLTSDNPRTEDPGMIISQTEAGIIEEGSRKKGEGYFVVPDRDEAISLAVGLARTGDVVLLAGKGHEDYQIIGDTKHHFDDREVARKAIAAKLAEA